MNGQPVSSEMAKLMARALTLADRVSNNYSLVLRERSAVGLTEVAVNSETVPVIRLCMDQIKATGIEQ